MSVILRCLTKSNCFVFAVPYSGVITNRRGARDSGQLGVFCVIDNNITTGGEMNFVLFVAGQRFNTHLVCHLGVTSIMYIYFNHVRF